MEKIKIPRYLDMPHQLLFWSADELVPFALLFAVGLLSETLPLCILLGLASTYFFRRFRNARPDGYLMHALYWSGLLPLKARSAINPYIRRVVP